MDKYNDNINKREIKNIIQDTDEIIQELLAYELYESNTRKDNQRINTFVQFLEAKRNEVIANAYDRDLITFNEGCNCNILGKRNVTITSTDDYE